MPPHGHPRLTSSSAASEKQAQVACPSDSSVYPRYHHETLSIEVVPFKGRLRLKKRRGRDPQPQLPFIMSKSSTARRGAELTKGPPWIGLSTLTCFSFSSSSRRRSSMQLRACRKAFLCERSVKIRTKTPYMFTPTKSRALAPSCRERTGTGCRVHTSQEQEGLGHHGSHQEALHQPLSQLQTHRHPGVFKHCPDPQ